MSTTHEQPFLIDRPSQLAVLASPLRQEIVDAITAAGSCSIAEVGALLGRPADRLYFHFKHLLKAGLLVKAGTRKDGRAVAQLFDVPRRPVRLRYLPEDAKNVEGVRGVFDGVLRLARRDFKRALQSGDSTVSGPRRDTWGGRVKGWLTDEQIEELNRSVESISRLMASARPREGARPVAFTFVIVPEEQKSATPKRGPTGNGAARSQS